MPLWPPNASQVGSWSDQFLPLGHLIYRYDRKNSSIERIVSIRTEVEEEVCIGAHNIDWPHVSWITHLFYVYSATSDDNCAYCSSCCCDRNDAAANGCHNYTDRFVAVYLVAVVCLMDYCT